jgi:hypothetical protein
MKGEFPYDVFLSHSAKDKAVVRPLAERLRKDGLKVWFNEWVIKPGDNIPAKIEEGLEHSRVLVLCMSANAFGSDWAQLEVGTFRFRDPLNKEHRFIPLRLDDAPIKGSLAQFLYINWLPADREQEYAKLLEACQLGKIPKLDSWTDDTGWRIASQKEVVPDRRARDDFKGKTKDTLARRVGMRCSNPSCQLPTSGPHSDPNRAINVGVAAHIAAAATGGPRFDARMSQPERTSIRNGIWLCQNCAKLVDNDETRFTASLLRQWKTKAEQAALQSIETSTPLAVPSLAVSGESAHNHMLQEFLQRLDESLAQTNRQPGKSDEFEGVFVTTTCRPLNGTPATTSPTSFEAIEWALAHLDTAAGKRKCLVVADYGLGKSHLAKHLFRHLKKRWEDKGGHVPILFPLRRHHPSLHDESGKFKADLLDYLLQFRFPVRDVAHLDELMASGSIDLILDGVDEMPLIQVAPDPAAVFTRLVEAIPPACGCLLTSRKGLLAPLLLQNHLPCETPCVEINPWDQERWREFAALCLKRGIFETAKSYHDFLDFVAANASLAELTKTPLYARMLIEAHVRVLNIVDLDLTHLYRIYAETVLARREQAALDPKDRMACLEALAAFLSENRRGFCTWDELGAFIDRYLHNLGAHQLKLFLSRDLQTYSLLNISGTSTSALHVAFSHKSYFEYFLARDVLRCLQQMKLPTSESSGLFAGALPLRGTCSLNQLLEMGVLEFIARFLRQKEYSSLLGQMTTVLRIPATSRCVDPVVRRNIAVAAALSTGSLDDVSLPLGTEFSALRLDNLSMQRASLNGLRASCASFVKTDLRGASLVHANLSYCNLREANLREANLDSALLKDLLKVHPPPLLAGARLEGIQVTRADLYYICGALLADPECPKDGHDVVKSIEAQAVIIDDPGSGAEKVQQLSERGHR